MIVNRPFVTAILSLTVIGVVTTSCLRADDLPAAGTERLPAILTADPLKAAAGADELHKLRTSLYNERQALTAAHYKAYMGGYEYTDTLFDSARQLMKTGLELHSKPQDKIDFLNKMQEFSKKVEDIVKSRPPVKTGRVASTAGIRGIQMEQDQIRSREFALEVEIALLKAKKEEGGKKD